MSVDSNNAKWHSWGKWAVPNTWEIIQVWDGSRSFCEGMYRHSCSCSFLTPGGLSMQGVTLTVDVNVLWIWPVECNMSIHLSEENPECISSPIIQAQRAQEAVSLLRMAPYIWNKPTFLSWGYPCIKLECNNYITMEIYMAKWLLPTQVLRLTQFSCRQAT